MTRYTKRDPRIDLEGHQPIWTHEFGDAILINEYRVVDSQGVDLGPVMRCNIKTGEFVPARGEYRGQTLIADAPLRVMEL